MQRHSRIALQQLRSGLAAPRNGVWRVHPDEPARSVMTDFTQRNLVTVDGRLAVDDALEVMKHAGVRSAFVLDAARARVLGFVTAHDVLGEKPIRHVQAMRGLTRRDVTVEDVMDRAEDWQVAWLEDVETATVGSVLEVFRRSGRTHVPVVERDEEGEPRLRGVFSCAKLLRLARPAHDDAAAGFSARW